MHPKDIDLAKAVIKGIDKRREVRSAELDFSQIGASSIMYCLLRQYYNLTGVSESNPKDNFEKYKLYQGDISEAEMALLIGEGLDSKYSIGTYPGPDVEDLRGIRHTPDRILLYNDTRLCPIEFKNIDTYTFMKIALNGLKTANFPYYVQCMLYAYAYGFEGTKFFAVAKSPAAVKTDIERKMKTLSKKPGVQSVKEQEKLILLDKWSYQEWVTIDMEVIDLALQRADILNTAKAYGTAPDREYTPGENWQCDYCPFMEKCIADHMGI